MTKMTLSYRLRNFWGLLRSKNKVSATQQRLQNSTVSSREVDDIEGTVQLKNGQAVQVRLDELKQFIEDNRSQIAVQKIPNMGKRRS
ncbi:hypothetical protein [Nostoc sp. GT001]|uniref:hypothetical protein n=1 Tax=Nostoc sp. GT001 TaxID=3056647 RepID=UPI0025AB5A37|nr:hypothetical protein [Nostoc sp. GT001]MDM9583688.1 hypothetical protein [Nostoc sp. GT001]